MSTEEGRYSKVTRRKWNDARYLKLSAPPPNAQTLFDRLLTGPELSNIPGVFQARASGLAEALGWPLDGFRSALREIIDVGLCKFDERTGLWWLPNAIKHNPPESPNVIKSWRDAWKELPECDLRDEAENALMQWAKAKGEPWAKAFAEVTGRPSPKANQKPSRKASPQPSLDPLANQEQEQEQEQEDPPSPPSSPSTKREHLSGPVEAVMLIPIAERSRLALLNEFEARPYEPDRWPEVIEAAGILHTGLGLKGSPKLGQLMRDSGTKRILELLAAGFTIEELRDAGPRMRGHRFLREARKLSAIIVSVMRELVDQADPENPDPPEQPRTTTRELMDGPGPASADAVARKERAEQRMRKETDRKLGLTGSDDQ